MSGRVDPPDSSEPFPRHIHAPETFLGLLAGPFKHKRQQSGPGLRESDIPTHVLAATDFPYLIVDEQMKLLWANRVAFEAFEQNKEAEQTSLDEFYASVVAPERWHLVVRELEQADSAAILIGSEPALVRELPHANDNYRGSRRFLVQMSKTRTCDPGILSMVSRSFGLTRSEAQVLSLLTDGVAPANIAEQRQVSEFTVRSQIKSIKIKLGCRSITALVVKVARFPSR